MIKLRVENLCTYSKSGGVLSEYIYIYMTILWIFEKTFIYVIQEDKSQEVGSFYATELEEV